MKKTAILISAFLSVSAAQSNETIDQLVAASKNIATKLEQGRYAVAGANYYAGVGGIVEIGDVVQEDFIISEQDVTNYNSAIDGVRNALYYTTSMALEAKHEEAMVAVANAIDDFVVASHQLAVVEEVAEKAEVAQATESVEEQIAVQEFVEVNDVELQQETVVQYNQSLEDIAVNAREAGAFLAASKNASLTDISDGHAQDFGQSMAEASISYSATNDSLYVAWADQIGDISFHGFLYDDMKTAAEVLGEGQAIYNEQQSYMYQ